MICELRVYRVVQGRMADLLARFEHQTLRIMVPHGFLQAGFWTTIVGRSEQLTYLLAWESLAQRQEQWAAFEPDAEWLAIRKSTEKNGPSIFEIESSPLRTTNFSAAK
jgi:heme-degrading monooxygenase HmoA